MQVNMLEAKTDLSKLVRQLEAHEQDVVYHCARRRTYRANGANKLPPRRKTDWGGERQAVGARRIRSLGFRGRGHVRRRPMKLLLDTHMLLWTLADDSRLPSQARLLAENPDHRACHVENARNVIRIAKANSRPPSPWTHANPACRPCRARRPKRPRNGCR